MAFLMLRGNRIRTYHWVGIVEFVIMALWVPPIYVVSKVSRELIGRVSVYKFDCGVGFLRSEHVSAQRASLVL
jgi:hypothetical protein